MAVSFVQGAPRILGSTATSHATTALSSAATAGNLLVAVVSVDKSSGAFSTPAGWTQLAGRSGTSVSLQVLAKVAAGGETGVTFSWTTARTSTSVIAEFSGVDTADPFGPTHFPAYSDTDALGVALNPGAAEANGAALVALAVDSGPLTAATGPGMTTYSSGVDATGMPGSALLYRTDITVGQDLASATYGDPALSDQYQGYMVLLNEASAGADPLPLALGATAVDALYVGSAAVDALYLGSTLLWSS